MPIAQDSITSIRSVKWGHCRGTKGKACLDKVHREDRLNKDDLIIWVHTRTIIIPLFSIILRRMRDLGRTTINPILHHTISATITLHESKTIVVRPADSTASLHVIPTPDCVDIRSDPRRDLAINGANDADELTCGRNTGLRQDERPTDDR